VLAVHLGGGFRLVRAGLRHMKDAGSGSLLLTASTAGLYGVVGQANYASAKAGLVGLMRVAALEGQRYGVRANAVVPLAATRSTSTHSAGTEFANADRYPVDDVVSLVIALSHPSCPHTGQLLLAGGGWYSRIAVEVADGWQASQASAEEIREHWDSITGPSSFREFSDGLAVRPHAPPLWCFRRLSVR
jgi:NAD(P)-dependent dehydrogenase (short-subunit alcohol dehydrogenase family)